MIPCPRFGNSVEIWVAWICGSCWGIGANFRIEVALLASFPTFHISWNFFLSAPADCPTGACARLRSGAGVR